METDGSLVAVNESVAETQHPMDRFLRQDRLPHIWCSGCGLGTALNCFLGALIKSKLDPDKVAVVSGIGCSGRAAGYVNMDSFHTTHGRAIPFATGLKLANPALKVVVFSGDGDLIAIGGNHFIHAARRNMDLTVICVNNFIYGMTGGQLAPTTPTTARTSTSPTGNRDHPFNLAYLAAQAGLFLRRDHQPMSHPVWALEQAKEWAGPNAILQGQLRHPSRRGPAPGGYCAERPNCRGQVCGPG
jgi:2-oxoglutarate ferredoxin oxidoreductase subunit beta